ncbi:MAG TPA: peptidoglycan-binding protein, partial [Tianweitania sediminis]|nr:peptidoglycan-binding protein [Tianweitania sediminis]
DRRQTDSVEQGNLLLQDLEARLDAIVERLDLHAEQRPDQGEILSMMDERFAVFAARLDERVATGPEAESIRELEQRLGEIATRLDESLRQSSSIDEGIIGRLEAQVAEMSLRLSQPAHALPDFEDLAPRFDQIERTIASQHQSLIGAARSAAAEAVAEWADRTPDPQAIVGLSDELRSLEALTRKSDERNSKTFEAIHDTLIKIVDRLSSMEQASVHDERVEDARDDAETAPAKPLVADAPSIAADDVTLLTGDLAEDPAEEAAIEAPIEPTPDVQAPVAKSSDDKRSVLGGLTKALRGRKDKRTDTDAPAQATAPRDEPGFPSLDQPLDPMIANQPLEPGSGAPDLNAIMKRVRDERGPIGRKDDIDAAKSDFIAAARRAAQAAAAEAVIKKRGGDSSDGNRSKLGKMLGLRRKTVLMATAAVFVGMGGLQLGRAYLSDGLPRMALLDDFFPPEAPRVALATEEPPLPPMLVAAETKPSPDTFTPAPLPAELAVEAGENKNLALDEPRGPEDVVTASTPVQAVPMIVEAAVAPQSPATLPVLPAVAEKPEIALEEPAQPDQPVAVAALSTGMPSLDLNEQAGVQPAAAESLPPITVPVTAGPVALREAAETGDAKALYEIASRFAEGRNGAVDMKAAAEWYLRAAEIGYAPAQYRAGNFYEKGLGVDRDIAKAKAFYEASAAQGNPSAMHNLAVLHAMGADGTTNNPEAVRWFKQAADYGVEDSQFNLGILAAKGVGMPQDLAASYKWFSLVAADGDKDAEAKRDEVAAILKPEELERARAEVAAWRAKPQDPAVSEVDVPNEWREGQDT